MWFRYGKFRKFFLYIQVYEGLFFRQNYNLKRANRLIVNLM